MKAILAGHERYLTHDPHRKAFSIIQDKLFVPSNEALDSHLQSLAKTGVLSSTKHKPALEREDVEQLFAARQLGNDTPESLVQTAWFYLMLYFGKRARENQPNLVKNDIVFGIWLGIFYLARASDKKTPWRPSRQRRQLAGHNV